MDFIDFTTPSFYDDPYPFYKTLRDEAPFVSLMPNIWVTGRYGVADTVLRDRRFGHWHQDFVRQRYGEDRENDPVFRLFYQMLLMINPPQHTHVRAMLMKTFNAKHTEEFARHARSVADELIDSFIDQGSVDLVEAFAWRLPTMVIVKLLGLDEAETGVSADQLRILSTPFVRAFEASGMSNREVDEANASTFEMQAFFQQEIDRRRRQPRHDLISQFIAAEENGLRMSDEEIIANIVLLFLAGHETTANMIGNALVTLYRHSGELARLRRDLSLIRACVIECLRFESSIQMAMRDVLEDMEFEGYRFKRGDSIFLCLGAANRDPAHFSEPDTFRIDRPDVDARQLINFGGGAHYCLGARLSTIELEVAIGALFERLPDLRIDNFDQVTWRASNTLRGVESLHGAWSRHP
ncbi:cytochrome P450 [Pararobbsia silviterrae]|uniref:Cytochrome P450 n=1 Tax=Pararobbsia silviterrae TaxID=1792498 RepID=A0A494XSM2_9BURK|nr:cytochrome P450 [Pararobbsia silviterrae]RKP53607.1 cytochrome P450 [Pararobbsia silviterrae]